MFKNISDKNSISLDSVCYLISYATSYDDIGRPIKTPTEALAFCAETSAFSSEFFNAGQQGIKPSKVLLVDSEGYNEQIDVKYNDEIYNIYRTFARSAGFTELYLNRKEGAPDG